MATKVYTSKEDFLEALSDIDTEDLKSLQTLKISDELAQDEDFIFELILEYNTTVAMHFMDKSLQSDHDFALRIVQQNGHYLEGMSEEFRNDEHIVLAALREEPYAIEYVGDELKNNAGFIMTVLDDEEIMEDDSIDEKMFVLATQGNVPFAIIEKACSSIDDTEDEEDDDEFDYYEADEDRISRHLEDCGILRIMKAIDSGVNLGILEYAEHYQDNKYVAWRAIRKSGFWGLRHVSKRLQDDIEIVMHAIQHLDENDILRFIGPKMQNNKQVIRALVAYSPETMEHLNKEYIEKAIAEGENTCWNNKAFVQEIVAVAPKVLENLPESIGSAFKSASGQLHSEREIVLASVQNSGSTLESASEELRGDREIVMAAVQNVGYALNYASKECQNDREIVVYAVVSGGWQLIEKSVGKKLLKDQKAIVAEAEALKAKNQQANDLDDNNEDTSNASHDSESSQSEDNSEDNSGSTKRAKL